MELTDPLLLRYSELLRRKELYDFLDKMVPDSSIFDLITSMAGSSAANVVERLSSIVEGRLDRKTAAEAYAEMTGVYDEELAVRSLARHMAHWYLKIAEELGLVRLK
ncbi:MAG: hypothetical protein QXP98_05010 [Thermoproteus sp.]